MLKTLYVRSGSRYREANRVEVLDVAASYIAHAVEHDRMSMSSPSDAKQFLFSQLAHCEEEHFCVCFLDNKHRLISFDKMFRGTIDGASVHPREVVKAVLGYNAAAVVFAHNHPSGDPIPSQADELITRRLKDALAMIDVRVLDHMIIGEKKGFSFAENGLL